MPLEFDHYRLRKPEAKDAAAIFRNYTQSETVTKYLIWKPHQTLQDSIDWIAHCQAVFHEDTNLKYVIALKSTDEAIGMIDAAVDGFQAGIGYVLAEPYWGKNIMTQALKIVLDKVLALPGVYRVWALHDLDNPASGRVMEKAGMKYEGLVKRGAILPNLSTEPRDVKLYAITK